MTLPSSPACSESGERDQTIARSNVEHEIALVDFRVGDHPLAKIVERRKHPLKVLLIASMPSLE